MTAMVASARALREQAEVSFASAAASCGVVVKDYLAGGQRLRLRFAGAAVFAAVDPALAHLSAPADPPSSASAPGLTVDLFASRSAPISLRPDQWRAAATLWKRGGASSPEVFLHHVPGDDGRLTILLPRHGHGFVCFKDIERIASWDRATPLREALNAWFPRHGGQIVHGAVVGDEREAVLLAAPGGSGKSGTALACLAHSSLFYLGDDLCLIRQGSPHCTIHSLYNSAKLLPHDLDLYADLHLVPIADRAEGDGKPTFFLYPAFRDKLAADRPLKAILLPRLTGRPETRLGTASRADAMRALVPTTLALLPGDPTAILAWIAQLIQRVPIFRLDLGHQRERIPDAIYQALSRSGSGVAA